MALPINDQNLTGSHCYPIQDLGLTATIANSASSAVASFSTGFPATIVVLSSLVSGGGTLYLSRADAAANLNFNASPTVSLTLSGTSLQATTLDTTSAALYGGIRIVAGATGPGFTNLAVLVLYELRGGEDWFSVRAGSLNAVGGTWGNVGYDPTGYQDGSGVINLAVTASAS